MGKALLEEQNSDFLVDTAPSVEGAFETLKTAEYDVVVSDYMMPEKNGLEFLIELKTLEYAAPFILFTGRGEEEVAAEACEKGASGYVIKRGNPSSMFAQLSNQIRQTVQRRRAEEALRESEQKYRTLVELAYDGIIMTTGLERSISFANRRMGEMLGYTVEGLVQKKYLDLIHPDEREAALKAIEIDLTSRKPATYERRLVKKGGSAIRTLISTSMTDPRSRFSPTILVIKEIGK